MTTPVRAVANQYPGVNAHLNSYLQMDDHWGEFHNVYIGDLFKQLSAQVRGMGYTARVERSLRVWRDLDLRRPRADVLLYDDLHRPFASVPTVADSALRQPVLEFLEVPDEEEASALAVYESRDASEPVAWFELLSPSNKSPDGLQVYRTKRRNLVESGVVFVEIDLLHTQPPTFTNLMGTTPAPYYLVVLDPRPSLHQGEGVAYPFHTGDPIPTVPVTLNAGDVLTFDAQTPYTKTFVEGFFGDGVDYALPPPDFHTYAPTDRARILARMVAVLTAHAHGDNLETGTPLPVAPLSLAEAVAQYQHFQPDFEDTPT